MAHHARLIRRVHFTASHHYGRPDAPERDDQETFGEQVKPHQHRWTVELQVVGPVDPDTGWLTDLVALDRAVETTMEGWDGGDLNRVIPAVAEGGMQPSTENLARWLYQSLESAVAAPARLAAVRVFESETLGSQYPA